MEPESAAGEGEPVTSRASGREERSLSPDLVSLSSTSDNEVPEDEPGVLHHPHHHQHLSSTPADTQASAGSHSGSSSTPDTTAPQASATADVMPGVVDAARCLSGPVHSSSPSPQHFRSLALESDASMSMSSSLLLESPVSYKVLDKSKLAATEYESRGLLYARASAEKHNM